MPFPSAAEVPQTISVRSASFTNGSSIPRAFSGEGSDISPDLSWSGVPRGAKSLVLTVDDPDAPRGVWNHWYVYNIPPATTHLSAGASAEETLPEGSIEALNDFKQHTYGGPCPPSGRHRYIFRLRALNTLLDNGQLSRRDIEREIQGHVLAEGELMGWYP
jgi:Raf kinase inhibitor-like YbhB/YbcL family protein